MKNLSAIITAVMIIALLGFLAVYNCNSDNINKTTTISCSEACEKACCLGCLATKGDAVCLDDHSCCLELLQIYYPELDMEMFTKQADSTDELMIAIEEAGGWE